MGWDYDLASLFALHSFEKARIALLSAQFTENIKSLKSQKHTESTEKRMKTTQKANINKLIKIFIEIVACNYSLTNAEMRFCIA